MNALEGGPLADAKTLLLSLIDPDVTDGVGDLDCPDDTTDYLAALLARIANADTAVAERLLYLTDQPLSPKRRQIGHPQFQAHPRMNRHVLLLHRADVWLQM